MGRKKINKLNFILYIYVSKNTLWLCTAAPLNGEGDRIVGGTPACGPLDATQLRQFNRKLNSAWTSAPCTWISDSGRLSIALKPSLCLSYM